MPTHAGKTVVAEGSTRLFCCSASLPRLRPASGRPAWRTCARPMAGAVDAACANGSKRSTGSLDPEQLDDRTWRYDLIDPRTETHPRDRE